MQELDKKIEDAALEEEKLTVEEFELSHELVALNSYVELKTLEEHASDSTNTKGSRYGSLKKLYASLSSNPRSSSTDLRSDVNETTFPTSHLTTWLQTLDCTLLATKRKAFTGERVSNKSEKQNEGKLNFCIKIIQ